MANVVSYNSYKLQKGASAQDFLLATEVLIKEFVSKQKGFISFKHLFDGETWADFLVFESMYDLNAFVLLCEKNELTRKHFSTFGESGTLKSHTFTIKQSF